MSDLLDKPRDYHGYVGLDADTDVVLSGSLFTIRIEANNPHPPEGETGHRVVFIRRGAWNLASPVEFEAL